MANNIKGITIELNGDTTGLDKALKDVNKETSNLQKELREVETALKFNPGNMELLAQKSEILGKEIETVSQKLKTLRDAQEQVNEQFAKGDISDEQYRAFTREIIKTESQLGSLEKSLDNNKKAMDGAGDATDDLSKDFDGAGKSALTFGDVLKANILGDLIISGIKAVASAVKEVGTAMIDTAKEAAAYADDMLTMASVTGMSTDSLQAYNYAAGLVDVSLETLTGSMARNIKSMTTAAKGTGDVATAYNKLGVQVTNADGSLRDSETVYWETIDALGALSDETERDSLSMQIFGKSAQDLNPLIAQGSAGIAELTEEAKNMGAVLDENTLNGLGQLDDSLQRLEQSGNIVKNTIGGALAPVLSQLATDAVAFATDIAASIDKEELQERVTEIADTVKTFVLFLMDNGPTILSIIVGIGAGFAAWQTVSIIMGIIKAFQAWRVATEGMTIAQAALNAIMAANPIGLVITIVAALVAAIITLMITNEDFRKKVIDVWNNVVNFIKDCVDMLIAAFNVVVNFLKNNWKEILLFITNPIAGALAMLYKLNPQFKAWVDGVFSTIIKTLKELPGAVVSIGEDIVSGLWNGIKDGWSWLTKKVKSLAKSLLDAAKSALGINSPSKEFAKLGVFSAEGFGVGFDEEMANVNKEIDALLTTNLDADIASEGAATNQGGVVVNFYPKQMTESELDKAFNYCNKRLGMAI